MNHPPPHDLALCQGTWDTIPDDVGEEDPAATISRLYQNMPNPSGAETTIKFSLSRPGPVSIDIFDVQGRIVKKLVDGTRDAGLQTVVWDGTNTEGERVAAGLYWTQMKSEEFVSTKKMLILK